MSKQVSTHDKRDAFLQAVHSFAGASERWQQRAASGLTDAELEQALRYELGISGGRFSSDNVNVSYQRAGLKIWAGWGVFNHFSTKPILEGTKTVAFAREVFRIPNPDHKQMSLF